MCVSAYLPYIVCIRFSLWPCLPCRNILKPRLRLGRATRDGYDAVVFTETLSGLDRGCWPAMPPRRNRTRSCPVSSRVSTTVMVMDIHVNSRMVICGWRVMSMLLEQKHRGHYLWPLQAFGLYTAWRTYTQFAGFFNVNKNRQHERWIGAITVSS
jgi:hypothetical protein